jgi:hypothetical protein
MLSCVITALWVQARIHAAEISVLNKTHATGIENLTKAHDAEISRLQESHDNETSRQTKDYDDMVILLNKAADQRATDSYAAGLGAAHPFVYRGVATKRVFGFTKKRDIALAVISTTKGEILGAAGDYADLEQIKMPPELKKALVAWLAHGGGGLPGLVA